MASRQIILNSRFQPFSYQEMLHPVATATQAHQNLEMEMGDLSSQAAQIASFANEQTDPISYNKYKMYAAQLQQQAEELGSRGLTPGSRRGLVSARDSFAKDIMPIAQAHQRKMQLVEEQRQASLQNPTFFTDRDANTISLDELVADPSTSYKPASGIALEQQVATRVQHLAKRFSEDPAELRTILNGQQFEYVKARGFDPSVIAATIMQAEGGSELLNSVVEETIAQSGIANWNNPEALQKAYSHARQGLWAAVGEEQMQLVTNQDYAFNQKVALMRMQQQMQQQTQQLSDEARFKAMGIDTKLDSNKQVQKIQKLIDRLKGNSTKGFHWGDYLMDPANTLFQNPYDSIKKLEKRISNYENNEGKWYEGKYIGDGVDWTLDFGPLGKLNLLTTDAKAARTKLKQLQDRFGTPTDRELEQLNIDPNLPQEQILEELKKQQNEAVVKYAAFDLTATSDGYKHLASQIEGIAADRRVDKTRTMNEVWDHKGEKAEVNVLHDALKEGRIVRTTYNRDPKKPTFDITVADKNGDPSRFTIAASMISQIHIPLSNIHKQYEMDLNLINARFAAGSRYEGISEEERDGLIYELNMWRNTQELNIIYDKVFQGYNPRMGDTKTD